MSLKIKKKYGIRWYTYTCNCGKHHKIPLLYLNILFSFKNKYYHKCCNCFNVVCLKNIQNIILDSTDNKLKQLNKR